MRLLTTILAIWLTWTPFADAQGWSPQTSGTTAVLNGVHFIDTNIGFAVGEGGVIVSTSTGGDTWTLGTLPAEDLESIAFNPAGTIGIIVTDDGPVFRTTDSGTTWNSVATGAGDLRDVDWADDNVVWVAGRDGDAAVSTDGGATWTYRNSGSVERTESVLAVSATEALVGNREGELRRTTDGGVTWAPIATGIDRDLNDMQIIGSTGYISGNGETILKSTDGGASWTNISDDTAGDDGLFFLDANTGWTVGDVGEIWFTENGGTSWTLQLSGTGVNLTEVHFPTLDEGWAVGSAGVIVHYSSTPTANEPSADLPDGYHLSNVYPNPFNPQARFSLQVAETQQIRISLYDVLGRFVRSIHNGRIQQGEQSFELNADGLTTGNYVLQVVGETFATATNVSVVR